MSLRDRQIREVLDEDMKQYGEVLKREFQQARLMNESYAPPNRLERKTAFEIDKFFIELTKNLDDIISGYTNTQELDTDAVRKLLATYETLIAFLDRYASSHPLNQRDLSALEDKFDALLPNLEKMNQIADEIDSPVADQINGLYNLLESRDYISLRGNVEPVRGRTQMLVDREEDFENPHYNPDSNKPEYAVVNRDYQNIREDEAINYDLAAEGDVVPDRAIEEREREADDLRLVIQETEKDIDDAHTYMMNNPDDEGLKRLYDMKVDRIRSLISRLGEMQRDITQLYILKNMREMGEREQDERQQRKSWSPLARRGRERLTKDKLKEYIDGIDTQLLIDALDELPYIKEKLGQQKNKASVKTKIKKNEAYMRDIYSLLAEGVRPTEHISTPRGPRQPSRGMYSESDESLSLPRSQSTYPPFTEQEKREIFPEEYPEEYEPYLDPTAPVINPFWAGEEEEGNGRQSFVKTKKGRFQMRGKGESEDKMYGLPVGFRRQLRLHPEDRKPLVHYDGQNFNLTLQDRMEFLDHLDSHKISDEEFKLNSIKNLAEMKDRKYKKKPLR